MSRTSRGETSGKSSNGYDEHGPQARRPSSAKNRNLIEKRPKHKGRDHHGTDAMGRSTNLETEPQVLRSRTGVARKLGKILQFFDDFVWGGTNHTKQGDESSITNSNHLKPSSPEQASKATRFTPPQRLRVPQRRGWARIQERSRKGEGTHGSKQQCPRTRR